MRTIVVRALAVPAFLIALGLALWIATDLRGAHDGPWAQYGVTALIAGMVALVALHATAHQNEVRFGRAV